MNSFLESELIDSEFAIALEQFGKKRASSYEAHCAFEKGRARLLSCIEHMSFISLLCRT